MRILFILLDGVGIGDPDPAYNPFMTARIPTIQRLCGGERPVRAVARAYRYATPAARNPTSAAREWRSEDAGSRVLPLDATLGVPGLPQSGTGQVALLTGENAPRRFGRHFGPWAPTALRPLLAEESVLASALSAGRRVAFANAYPEHAAALLRKGARMPRSIPGLRAAATLAAYSAGLLTRHAPALAAGRAVASEILNDGWREQLGHRDVPRISAEDAGRNLSALAADHDLTFFAHYTTDIVGHRGTLAEAAAALERVDAFLAGVLDALPHDTLLVVASDHGNIEDARGGHTRNPALAFLVGSAAKQMASRMRSLTDVAPAVLACVNG